jgi:hypothetical protein
MVTENMDVLAALLRLGSKYDMPALRALAVSMLEASCPSSLHAYWDLWKRAPIRRSADDYKVMLHLARECNVPHVVPICMWQLQPLVPAHYTLRQLREPFVSPATGMEYRLDEATMSAMLVAIWMCIDRYAEIMPTLFNKSNSCLTEDVCVLEFNSATESFNQSYRDILLPVEDIAALATEVICRVCKARITTAWSSAAATTWQMLPQFYDLQPWDDLRASLAAEE